MGLGRASVENSAAFNLSEIFFAPQRRDFVLSFVPYGGQFQPGARGPRKHFTAGRGP